MKRQVHKLSKAVAAALALACAFAVLLLAGCLSPVGDKLPAWIIHVTEDQAEEHLAGNVWRETAYGTHMIRFFADGTWEEKGGSAKVLPEAEPGATWQVLFCDAEGWTNWSGVSVEDAEGVFAYRLVIKGLSDAAGKTRVLTLAFEDASPMPEEADVTTLLFGDVLLLDGNRFVADEASLMT